jgi:lipopolysaccharide assembly protein A
VSDDAIDRTARSRPIAVLLLTGLGVVFALLNTDEVDVNWLLGTWSTPLIVVIAVSMLIGAGLGLLVARRRAR